MDGRWPPRLAVAGLAVTALGIAIIVLGVQGVLRLGTGTPRWTVFVCWALGGGLLVAAAALPSRSGFRAGVAIVGAGVAALGIVGISILLGWVEAEGTCGGGDDVADDEGMCALPPGPGFFLAILALLVVGFGAIVLAWEALWWAIRRAVRRRSSPR